MSVNWLIFSEDLRGHNKPGMKEMLMGQLNKLLFNY